MVRTVEAVLERDGRLRLLEHIDTHEQGARFFAVIVSPASSEQAEGTQETRERSAIAALSEGVLARDWLRPEEDEAWKVLDRL